MATKEKMKKDPATFQELYKQFSNDFHSKMEYRTSPSGSVIMDSLLGGGVPRGKLIEVYSKAGVGKTTLAKHLAESIIKYTDDETVLYLDVEKGLTEGLLKGPLMEQFGKRFAVFRISSFEEAENIILAFASTGKLAFVVIDSITALLPQEVLDKPIGEIRPGMKAQWESIFLNKQKALADQLGYSILFVNQVRTKLNFKGITKTEGSGGNALSHFVDVRFALTCIKMLRDENGIPLGCEAEIKSIKNRLVGNKKANIHLVYGRGVDNIATYVTNLAAMGYLKQAGAMYELTIPSLAVNDRVRGREALRALVQTRLADIEGIVMSSGVVKEVSDDEAAFAAAEASDAD